MRDCGLFFNCLKERSLSVMVKLYNDMPLCLKFSKLMRKTLSRGMMKKISLNEKWVYTGEGAIFH